MFVDLDWPLNASSLLSASAELLVFVSVLVSYAWSNGLTDCREFVVVVAVLGITEFVDVLSRTLRYRRLYIHRYDAACYTTLDILMVAWVIKGGGLV